MDTLAAEAGTTLRLRRKFAASPERVFEAWTRPEALRLWWCPEGWQPAAIEIDLRVGGSYRISMQRENAVQSLSVYGRFLEIQVGKRLVYTWNWEGAFATMPETQVAVEFRALIDGTELTLWQEELPLPLCTRHLSGWLAAFNRISAVLDG
jgi:uncharacterized protein YndB with AHSA1/START domain